MFLRDRTWVGLDDFIDPNGVAPILLTVLVNPPAFGPDSIRHNGAVAKSGGKKDEWIRSFTHSVAPACACDRSLG